MAIRGRPRPSGFRRKTADEKPGAIWQGAQGELVCGCAIGDGRRDHG